eukprot:6482354-Amphidinium_carterae.1
MPTLFWKSITRGTRSTKKRVALSPALFSGCKSPRHSIPSSCGAHSCHPTTPHPNSNQNKIFEMEDRTRTNSQQRSRTREKKSSQREQDLTKGLNGVQIVNQNKEHQFEMGENTRNTRKQTSETGVEASVKVECQSEGTNYVASSMKQTLMLLFLYMYFASDLFRGGDVHAHD